MNPIEKRHAFVARCRAKVNEAVAAGNAAPELKTAMDEEMLYPNEAAALLKKEPRLQKSFADKALAGMVSAEKRRKAVLAEERKLRFEMAEELSDLVSVFLVVRGTPDDFDAGVKVRAEITALAGEPGSLDKDLKVARRMFDEIPDRIIEDFYGALNEHCSCGHLRTQHDDPVRVTSPELAGAWGHGPCTACADCPQFTWTEFTTKEGSL
jgi:hypothetical protein